MCLKSHRLPHTALLLQICRPSVRTSVLEFHLRGSMEFIIIVVVVVVLFLNRMASQWTPSALCKLLCNRNLHPLSWKKKKSHAIFNLHESRSHQLAWIIDNADVWKCFSSPSYELWRVSFGRLDNKIVNYSITLIIRARMYFWQFNTCKWLVNSSEFWFHSITFMVWVEKLTIECYRKRRPAPTAEIIVQNWSLKPWNGSNYREYFISWI